MDLRVAAGVSGAALAASLYLALPAAAQPPAAPAGPPPRPWWEQSSLTVGPQARPQVHVEGTFSYTHADGNTDGYAVDLRSGVDVRRGRFTNRVEFDVDHRDMVYGLGGGKVDTHEHTVRDQLEYDLTKRALILLGVEGYRSTLVFLDRRTSVYAGAGVTLTDTRRHKLSVSGGLGRSFFEFDRAGMLALSPEIALLPTTSPSSGVLVLMQAFRTALPGRITLNQEANMTDYFAEILGRQYGFSVSADIPLARHVSVVPAFRLRDEGNIYTEALRIKEQDRTFTLGIRISY